MSKEFYVYRHIRLDTNQVFYVGKGHGRRAWGKTSGRNRYWKAIVAKTPYDVEIIMENLTEQEAFAKEIEFIALYKRLGYCKANLADGGQGATGVACKFKGIPRTEEEKRKISQSKMGSIPWNRGKTGIYTEAQLANLSAKHTGKKHSKESRQKRSQNSRNKQRINVYKAITRSFRKPGNPSKYERGEFVAQYESITLAAQHLNLVHQHIFRVLNKTRKQCLGYIFEYAQGSQNA